MKIGVFDSGYGGLTILRDIIRTLPDYDYVYLGDNARAPYGSRSYDIVYEYTLQAVKYLASGQCRLIILACNTASAKALRTIQQHDLPKIDPKLRVLGVIIPTVENIADISATGHIAVAATQGTIDSHSYKIETLKLNPNLQVLEHACPMWVPLIENNEAQNPGADYFVDKYCKEIFDADPLIDTLILGCTHYPLLIDKIKQFTPQGVNIISQGEIVADRLKDYLNRHPEIESTLSKNKTLQFMTSENPEKFDRMAPMFINCPVKSTRVAL